MWRSILHAQQQVSAVMMIDGVVTMIDGVGTMIVGVVPMIDGVGIPSVCAIWLLFS